MINNDYGVKGTVFRNGGTFRKSGGTGANSTSLLGGVFFHNSGTLDVQTNLLSLQGGGSFTGGLVTGAPGLTELAGGGFKIGRASCRDRGEISGGAVSVKKKHKAGA